MATVETKPDEMEQDDCGDHAIGRDKAYLYLEGKLSEQEAENFIAHMEYCLECLEIVVSWHYELAVLEFESQFPASVSEKKSWGWPTGSNARAKKPYPESSWNSLN